MLDRPLVLGLGLLALVSLVFLLLPSLDLAVSRRSTTRNRDLDVKRTPTRCARRADCRMGIGIVVVVLLVIKLALPDTRLLVEPRATLFVLAALAVGPGTMVNGIRKRSGGEAKCASGVRWRRHVLTTWWVSDSRARGNCSLSRGEAASASGW